MGALTDRAAAPTIPPMSDTPLDELLGTYLATPVTGERLGATYQLSIGLVGLLQRLAADRGAPVDALVEHLLFKAVRAENARRLVGEKPDPIPASFLDDRVARAKVELRQDVAAIKAHEERGDRATRIAREMQAVLDDATGADPETAELNRRIAQNDAKADQALDKKR